ncbi:MAG TPA: hypothetical protein VJ521_12280 [Acidobacteriota bacterium]|nr:hypothetical protein [Acidobacteriota bacterium]
MRDIAPSEYCERPVYFLDINNWDMTVHRDCAVDSWISVESAAADRVDRQRRAVRRAAKWWHKTAPQPEQKKTVNPKLAEAKMRHFTAKEKQERIAKALAALNASPAIQLSPEEWKQIVEDPDLEDQF